MGKYKYIFILMSSSVTKGDWINSAMLAILCQSRKVFYATDEQGYSVLTTSQEPAAYKVGAYR